MGLAALGAMFTVGVLVHNLEEALFLPRWSLRAGRWYRPVDRGRFALAAAAVSLLLLAFAIGAYAGGAGSLFAYLFCGYVFAMVVNALAPHLAFTMVTRRYMPGTATALLLNVPLGCAFLSRAVESGFVDLHRLVWAAPAVALSLAASIPAWLWLAGKLVPAGGAGTERRTA